MEGDTPDQPQAFDRTSPCYARVPDCLRPTGSLCGKTVCPRKALSTRRIIHLVLARPEQLTKEQQQDLEQVSPLHPEIATAFMQAQAIVSMVRERDGEVLTVWLSDALTRAVRELRAFAKGIERDRTAVEAAFSREESNGQIEGQITRLKFLKRSMSGRGSFALLR